MNYTNWEEDTLLRGVSDNWRFSLAALTAGEIYVLYWPFWGMLRGRLYSNGTLGSEEVVTPNSTYVLENAFAFACENGTVYAIWQEKYTGNVQLAVRTGSWNVPETITTVANDTSPIWTAGYDSARGEWYIPYYDHASNQILQWSGTPGNWRQSLLLTVKDGDSALLIGSYYNTGEISESTRVLGVYWVEANSSLTSFQLKFSEHLT